MWNSTWGSSFKYTPAQLNTSGALQHQPLNIGEQLWYPVDDSSAAIEGSAAWCSGNKLFLNANKTTANTVSPKNKQPEVLVQRIQKKGGRG